MDIVLGFRKSNKRMYEQHYFCKRKGKYKKKENIYVYKNHCA